MNKRSGVLSASGSVLVYLLAALPLFLALFFGLQYAFHSLILPREIKKICLESEEKTQAAMSSRIDELLALNIPARALRLQQKIKEIQLIAAIAGLPKTSALVARLKLEIQAIVTRRRQLERLQQGILLASQATMTVSLFQTSSAIKKFFQKFVSERPWLEGQILSSFGQGLSEFQKKPLRFKPELSVKPKDRDLAPEYELKDEFKDQQALLHLIKVRIFGQGFIRNWVKTDFIYKWRCGGSLNFNKEKKQWESILVADKY